MSNTLDISRNKAAELRPQSKFFCQSWVADRTVGVVKVTSLLNKVGSGLGFSFGVRGWTEMEIWCVKGIVSSQKEFKV